jgi:hypothetical protein
MNVITRAVLDMETMKWVSVESYEYAGVVVDLCCGPSQQENSLASSGANLSQTLSQAFGQQFANQGSLLARINSTLAPISAAGPSQNGFSGAERATLQTQAVNNAGAANTAAQQAARTYGAGQGGGGTSGVTSGITKQIQSAVGSQEAGTLGTNENNINLADEQQGNQNYWRSLGAQNALAGQYNPTAYGSEASNSNATAFGEADKINSENNAMGEDIAGFATGLAGSAGGVAKAIRG